MRLYAVMLAVAAVWLVPAPLDAGNWERFRGPNASGLAASGYALPTEIGPDKNVVWKTALPAGHSSPVIFGNRVYVTAVRGGRLLTIALTRDSGHIVWEREEPEVPLEEIHQIGSHAQSTPAADGRHVVSFFGSSGLSCHDAEGNLLWRKKMGPFKNNFGAGSSPIIVDGRVLLAQDHDTDSFLAAYDVHTGDELWKTDRSEFPRGYSSPVVWDNDGKQQVVVAGTLRIVGYDFDTGREAWTVTGISRIVNMTPLVGPDGILYVPAWAPGADDGDRIVTPPFAELAAAQDENADGTLAREEIPEGPLKHRFDQIDRDKSGQITAAEFESMRRVFDAAQNRLVAIKPGGAGDITKTHVLWSQSRNLPYCPSPVYAAGYLFMVKNGGIATSLDARTGEITRQGRVSGTGEYYSSPVAGDGKVYLLSRDGDLTVISADREWKVLAKSQFKEEAFATPALVDGRVFLRTAGHLYCFGEPE